MGITTTKTIVTPSKTASEIEIDQLSELPRAARQEVKERVGELLIEEILADVAAKRSPVTGSGFSKLSKTYGARKMDEVGNSEPNLDLTGEMLESLDFKVTKNGVEIGVYGSAAPRADGHNNLSGDSKLPTRQFLPDEGQGFRPEIRRRIDLLIGDIVAENVEVNKEDLEGIETRSALYAFLATVFEGLTQAQMRDAVLGNAELFQLLLDEDLVSLL